MVMILQTIFMANHLAVELVDEFVHGCVQVLMGAFGKHITAFDVDVAFGFLTTFFFLLILNAEEHFDIHHLIEMSRNSVQFSCHVAA